MSLLGILFLLSVIGILEERINGVKKAVVRDFADKIYNHYQALLGQSAFNPL